MINEIAPGIESDETKLNGKPIIKGTRIPVSFVLANLEDMSIQELAADLDITEDQIKSAIRYASMVTEAV